MHSEHRYAHVAAVDGVFGGWWVPSSCVLVGVSALRQGSVDSSPSCALAAPASRQVSRGWCHSSQLEVKSLQGLFLWALHNEVVPARMLFSCISQWHLIVLGAGGWAGWPLEVPAYPNYSVYILFSVFCVGKLEVPAWGGSTVWISNLRHKAVMHNPWSEMKSWQCPSVTSATAWGRQPGLVLSSVCIQQLCWADFSVLRFQWPQVCMAVLLWAMCCHSSPWSAFITHLPVPQCSWKVI